MAMHSDSTVEAIKHELFKKTGIQFTGVDHGIVTGFYSTIPLHFTGDSPAQAYKATIKSVYEGLTEVIKAHDIKGLTGGLPDATGYYGGAVLDEGFRYLNFEFRLPIETAQLPQSTLLALASKVGEIIAPAAEAGMKMHLTGKIPFAVSERQRELLGGMRGGGPDFSYN